MSGEVMKKGTLEFGLAGELCSKVYKKLNSSLIIPAQNKVNTMQLRINNSTLLSFNETSEFAINKTDTTNRLPLKSLSTLSGTF